MRVTFIQPKVGAKPGEPYPKTWQMEPLWAAALSALTPRHIERDFLDDRLEPIPVEHPTGLAAISVETYTARRAYQIAGGFRARGVPVVLGGFHATLVPDEAACHADAVVVGQAESVWAGLLDDLSRGRLKSRYNGSAGSQWIAPQPDRALYAAHNYGRLRLVETSRGCVHQCEFCSIASFYERRFVARPVAEVVVDIRRCGARLVFFVDDNLVAAPERLRELCEALMPLRIHWLGQIGIRVTEDESLLRLLRRSGCAGVLIGFESLNGANLSAMNKPVSGAARYEEALARLRRHGLSVYGTFVFGYDADTEAGFQETLEFAVRHGFFFAAFNHLVPFPGTPLHARLRGEGRLLHGDWWLADGYRFGDVAFRPARMSADALSGLCSEYRRRFYSWSSVCARMEFQANLNHPLKALAYFQQNLLAGAEVKRRLGLPLGGC
jgi:radical SAM superfamily enzyme YgiQ (UPF0313 family)